MSGHYGNPEHNKNPPEQNVQKLRPISDWSECDSTANTKKYLEKFGISDADTDVGVSERRISETSHETHRKPDPQPNPIEVREDNVRVKEADATPVTETVEPIVHRTRSRLKLS